MECPQTGWDSNFMQARVSRRDLENDILDRYPVIRDDLGNFWTSDSVSQFV